MAVLIGGVPVAKVTDTETATTLSMLVWGEAGVGKTTLAATAPGRKLLINFDMQGFASIRHIKDIDVADVSGAGVSVVDGFKNTENPMNLKAVVDTFDTLIVDSVTKAIERTLERGITANPGATIERPSPGAYGTRNALALQLIRNVARFCVRNKKHVIFIAHEDAPDRDKEGNVLKISCSLGGKLVNAVPADLSEVWHLSMDGSGKRRVAVVPMRLRSPMKTRMFITQGTKGEFAWTYDADKQTGMTLMDLCARWAEAGYVKVPLPA